MSNKPLSDSNYTLEKRLFESVCFLMFLLMVFLGFQAIWRFGFTSLVIVDFTISFLGIGLLFLSKRGYFSHLRWVLIGMLLIICPYFWMTLGGYHGSMRVGIIMVGTIILLLSEKEHKTIIFFVFWVLLLILNLIQYTHPELIVARQMSGETALINYVIYVSLLLYVIFLTKSAYEKERTSVENKNQALTKLNTNLSDKNVELKTTLERLHATQDQLVESEKMASVGRMTSALAHELNNPLNYVSGGVTPILNNIEEIKSFLDNETTKKTRENFEELENLLTNISEGSSKISSVIANLVRISSSQQGQGYQKFDFSYFLTESTQAFRNEHPEIELTTDLQNELVVKGQALEINQTVMVILENALQASLKEAKPLINVTLKAVGNSAVLTVGNKGDAIDSRIASRMFDPFFTTKKDQSHLGLGLYFAYGVVKRHSGKIKYSRQDGMTTFKVTIPIS